MLDLIIVILAGALFVSSRFRIKEVQKLAKQIDSLEECVRQLAGVILKLLPPNASSAAAPGSLEEAHLDEGGSAFTGDDSHGGDAEFSADSPAEQQQFSFPDDACATPFDTPPHISPAHEGQPAALAFSEEKRVLRDAVRDDLIDPVGETWAVADEGLAPTFAQPSVVGAASEFAEDDFSIADAQPNQEAEGRDFAGKGTVYEPGIFMDVIVKFIQGGNIWAAGGVIMLLIGFAFLAQLSTFSIELRIVLAAFSGMVMVGLGLYLRLKRPMYALIMQGGGIGILYLSVFAAAKIATLLPPAVALVIMTALIIPAVALAILQNAQVLALFAFMGGFAVPILLSDGSGNYVALFSYYTLLNLGILAICRYRLWRWLNFMGALATFVVLGYWGLTSYTVSMFSTVEPFFIGFLLIYILITLGAVRRDEFSFSEPLDVIMACAVPFVAAVFQWWIVMDIPHGLSVSAVLFGAFFIALAFTVWKLWGERTRRLAEYYLANGVVLANLAIPLELAGDVTSTVWAVEGAILFFFACRIRSTRIKVVALLVQVVGMGAFFWDGFAADEHILLSTSILAVSALASACFHKLDVDNPDRDTPEAINAWLGNISAERILAIVGLLWWYGGLMVEANWFADQPLVLFFGAVSLTSVVLYFAEKATGLRDFLHAAVGVPLLTAACCLLVFSGESYEPRAVIFSYIRDFDLPLWPVMQLQAASLFLHNFLVGWSALAWGTFVVTQIALLKLSIARVKPIYHAWWAGFFALEILFMLTSSARGVPLGLELNNAWGNLASIVPALAYTAVLTWLMKRNPEENMGALSADHVRILGGTVPTILFIPLGVWLFFSFFSTGNPAPLLSYVPLLNPLELQQVLCIATFALWQKTIHERGGIRFALPLPRLLLVLDVLLFAWLHSMLFRAVFYFTGTPMHRAWDHASFQVLLTALWGVWGMGHLIIGNRTRIRPCWVIGASLILADTLKLFLVDLADKGTLFRVISFFVMGGIFLLIGWLAPLPPSVKRVEEENTEGSLEPPPGGSPGSSPDADSSFGLKENDPEFAEGDAGVQKTKEM